jgi:uncharacterized membrane protein YvbJ
MSFCIKCGNNLEEGTNFCTQCGEKVFMPTQTETSSVEALKLQPQNDIRYS